MYIMYIVRAIAPPRAVTGRFFLSFRSLLFTYFAPAQFGGGLIALFAFVPPRGWSWVLFVFVTPPGRVFFFFRYTVCAPQR